MTAAAGGEDRKERAHDPGCGEFKRLSGLECGVVKFGGKGLGFCVKECCASFKHLGFGGL